MLRSEVGHQTGLRRTPTLAFIADALPDNAKVIDDLLQRAAALTPRSTAQLRGPPTQATPTPTAPRYRDEEAAGSDGGPGEGRPAGADAQVDGVTPAGLVVVDKPAGLTSHDVVARVRRLAGTRRVGHAGTLDPAATGVLVLGVDKGTKLLGHLALTDKDYTATIRLGQSTVTDDAEGELVASASAADLSEKRCSPASRPSPAAIQQVPSAVSAIKVDGQRSYARVRSGSWSARRPYRDGLHVLGRRVPSAQSRPARRRRRGHLHDWHLRPRAGPGPRGGVGRRWPPDRAAADPGGRLRPVTLASTLEQLEQSIPLVPISLAVARSFPRIDVDAEAAQGVGHGHPLPLRPGRRVARTYGVFGPDGQVLALMAPREDQLRALVVLAPGEARTESHPARWPRARTS